MSTSPNLPFSVKASTPVAGMYAYTDPMLDPHYMFYAQWQEANTHGSDVTTVTLFQDGSIGFGRWLGIECQISTNVSTTGIINYVMLTDKDLGTDVLAGKYTKSRVNYWGNEFVATCE